MIQSVAYAGLRHTAHHPKDVFAGPSLSISKGVMYVSGLKNGQDPTARLRNSSSILGRCSVNLPNRTAGCLILRSILRMCKAEFTYSAMTHLNPHVSTRTTGIYNPDSMYRVRVLAREGEEVAEGRDVGAVVRERLRTARAARRAIGIPSAETDTYRCVP